MAFGSPPAPTPIQICNNTPEYRAEYQREKEKTEYTTEYKTANHRVLKQSPDPVRGINCVSYAKSKYPIGNGYSTLAQKISHITAKAPKIGVAVTAEGSQGHLIVVEKINNKTKTLIISEGNFRHSYITIREIPFSLVIGYL